jgi:nitrogen regulatory protein PII
MFMVLLVLNDPDKLKDVLEAWESVNVPGVTVLHSTGLGKLRQFPGLWDDLPLLPNVDDFFEREELHSRTLLSVVPDEAFADKLVSVTKKILGGFNRPGTGLLVIMPLVKVYGLGKNLEISSEEEG